MGLFNFKNDQKMFNGVVFTCRHIMDKGERITYISHKENGDYECFCSNCEQKLDLNSVMIIGLDEILTENNKSLFNIEKGKYKTCSRCGQVKLAHPKYFSKNSTSKDGFYSICKECRNSKAKKS